MHRATLFAIGALLLFAIETPVRAATPMPVADAKDDGKSNADLPLNFQPFAGCFFFETFDQVTPPMLPPGWTAINGINPDGIFWQTSNSGEPSPPANSPPNAAWINDPDMISDKYLDSPAGTIDPISSVELTFSHNYALEDGFDGAVLEMSVDGGPFQDLGGSAWEGGYNGTISTCCGNPLGGRPAWTGNSGGFIQTTVDLPNGHTLVLRWRMASDSSGSGEGWRVDDVSITCERPTPSPTPFPTPSITPTPTVTVTPTPTSTVTVTPTPTGTPSITPSSTPTPRPVPPPRPRPTPLPRPTAR